MIEALLSAIRPLTASSRKTFSALHNLLHRTPCKSCVTCDILNLGLQSS
jgi:hypothetical protein